LIVIVEGNLDCPIPVETENGYVYKKPIEMITPLSWEYIKAFGFYEKSILPNGKGWLMESDKYIQAMQLIDNEMGKQRKKEIKPS